MTELPLRFIESDSQTMLFSFYFVMNQYPHLIARESWEQTSIEWKERNLLSLNTLNTGGLCNLIAISQPLDLNLH